MSRIKTVSGSVAIANGQATGQSVPGVSGKIKAILINAPVLTSANYTVAIVGPGTGFTLFSKASLSPNANTPIVADANNQLLNIPMTTDTAVVITTAGNEGSARTVPFKLLVEVG